ncbi:hypothetical protein C7S13_7895 [Burkholderia cepacia]|nr:hypothetical protein [Burkholderia cepacia]
MPAADDGRTFRCFEHSFAGFAPGPFARENTRPPPMRASRVMPHAIVACAAVTLRAHITHYHCAACTR